MYPSLTAFVISTIICVAWIDVVTTKNGDCTDLNLVKMNSCAVASQTQLDPSVHCGDKFGFNVRARDMPSYDRSNLTDLQSLYDYEMCLCNGYTSLAKVI